MIELSNKKVYFSGTGELINKKELEKYLSQKDVEFVPSLDSAEVIIEGNLTPPNISDMIYKKQLEKIPVVSIEELEIDFSSNFNISSVLMAIKLTKDNDRLVELLNNRHFSDETFIKLLKSYSWGVKELHDDDESRDVCRSITSRFCTLINRNHNIQYAPIGVYYTALETYNSELLNVIYNMPSYIISNKNAKENQPLTLKEVVALNPNSSKAIQLEIIKNNNIEELKYLALNNNLEEDIKEKLLSLNNEKININLLKVQNYILKDIDKTLEDKMIRKYFLKYYTFSEELFNNLKDKKLTDNDFIYLSSNEFLSSQMIVYIESKAIENAIINLLKNELLSDELKNKYIKLNDKIYNIAIAHNKTLNINQFELLFSHNDLDVNIALASNIKTPVNILKELYNTKERYIDTTLCLNISTPIQILMQLQLDNELKILVKENITYQKFAQMMLGFSE